MEEASTTSLNQNYPGSKSECFLNHSVSHMLLEKAASVFASISFPSINFLHI